MSRLQGHGIRRESNIDIITLGIYINIAGFVFLFLSCRVQLMESLE